MTARSELVAAVITRISSADFPVKEIDDWKKTATAALPRDYGEVHLATRTPGLDRLAARSQRMGWRLLIRVNAKTMTNVNVLLDSVHGALYDQTLTAAGHPTTRLNVEPSIPPADDNGWYSALIEFTFTH